MPEARRGVRLGVDVGSVRVGLAASDPSGLLASPVETLRRDDRSGTDLARIAAEVAEREALEVLVGLPRSLSGGEGPAAQAAREYARRLAALLSSGVPGRRQRAVVDQAAAVVLLQAALDVERGTGRAPGELVEPLLSGRSGGRVGHDGRPTATGGADRDARP